MATRRTLLLGIGATVAVAGWHAWQVGWLGPVLRPMRTALLGSSTIDEVMARYGDEALQRLDASLREAGFGDKLPARLRLIAFKEERLLEVWGSKGEAWRRITVYPVLAASGGPGPKLAEGDRQVPEGLYAITHLNPNSAYHLSLGVGHPNAADRAQAAHDGRTELGGDIMIHGKAVSVGCLALGDRAIEEVFALVARVGTANSDVVIVPVDLRVEQATDSRPWVRQRYAELLALLEDTTSPVP